MTQVHQSARSAAIANENAGIDASQSRAIAARAAEPPRKNALQAMAARMGTTAASLQATLINTAFKGATEAEFAVLVMVAEKYGLDPFLKHIYAFPQKGGGIVPVVSIDGWIFMVNGHPAFDGMEFKDIPDEKGNLIAVECTIWRNDRTRPIVVREYLSECRRETDPWKKSPARMLRHKALIQCARYAFGFSGIQDQDDAEVIDGGQLGTPMEPMPQRQTAQPADTRPVEDLDAARAAQAADESLEHLRDPADDAHDDDGVLAEPVPDPDPKARDAFMTRIKVSASVKTIERVIGDIEECTVLADDWRTELMTAAHAKKAELAGGAK